MDLAVERVFLYTGEGEDITGLLLSTRVKSNLDDMKSSFVTFKTQIQRRAVSGQGCADSILGFPRFACSVPEME